jgi:hypothetical protein
MKTTFVLALCALTLIGISCTDKSRVLSVVQNGKGLPDGTAVPIALYQNEPNPFSGSTTIRFATAVTQQIRLTVKTEDWVTVTTLVDTTLNAGLYLRSWSNYNLPSGEYLAVLEGGGITETIRMRLIK